LFVEDSVIETMNTYFPEEILNIQTELKEQNYNELFRRKSNIEIKEQNDQFLRRKPTINTNQLSTTQVSQQDEITKRQIEELVHNKVGQFVKRNF
jgi:hypothetical protein